ncbi:MAG TPA: preprotein translocase subunit SecE [Kiritimatiellia bacterium]|nr:preprotein translocase subunit SecE [Kiritimatiellia bacterium]
MNKLGQLITGTRDFVGEVQVELKKCTWPTRPELLESTVVVIVAVAILGAVVSLSDVILSTLLRVFTR